VNRAEDPLRLSWELQLAAALAALGSSVPDHAGPALLAERELARETLTAYRKELVTRPVIRPSALGFDLDDHGPTVRAVEALRVRMIHAAGYIGGLDQFADELGPGQGGMSEVEASLRRHLAEMHGAAAALLAALSTA
jgi:hypothetical protein